MSTVHSRDPSLLVCHSFPSTLAARNGIWNGDSILRHPFPALCLQICLAFFTTRAIYFVIKPLKQPKVLAEILAGIVLGPSVLGRSETFKRMVFPERAQMMLDTFAMFALLYFVFLIGVKLDPLLFKRLGRREIVVGVLGVLIPLLLTTALLFHLKDFLAKDMRNGLALSFLGGVISISSFSALVPTLSELHLLNTEVGRFAISLAGVSDLFGWSLVVMFIPLQASMVSPMTGFWAFLSVAALISFIFFVIRPLTIWVVHHTPEGKPIEDIYIFCILVAVLVIGFLSDLIGANSYNGALVLGLAIPEGPPLGSALVDKLDNLVSGIMVTLFYLMTGLKTDVSLIEDISTWGYLQLIFVVGCLIKLLATLLPSLYFKLPFPDAISLAVVMNCRGIPQIITYNHWIHLKIIERQAFTILVLSTVVIAGIVTPAMSLLSNPSRKYAVNICQTIQQMKLDREFRIVACVHNQANIPSMIRLLEASHGTKRSPLSIMSLHLVEMVGRTAPIFISHKLSRIGSQSRHAGSSQAIHHAFIAHQQMHQDEISVHPFTAVAPYTSMHHDVCTLALNKYASLIIVPFHKQPLIDGQMAVINAEIQSMNKKVLANAPCSVAILVDRAVTTSVCTVSTRFTYKILTIFVGGFDDREALAFTARMVTNPGISAMIMRFVPCISHNDRSRDHKLDTEAMEEFNRLCMNNPRVTFQESVVEDLEQIVEVIRHLARESYDLFMVGLRHDSQLLAGGITEWTECPELGFIGDLLATIDFANMASVLIVRQHVGRYFNGGDRVDRYTLPISYKQ